MDPVTVNIIAALLGVIFLTCLSMAIIKIVRSRHDAQNLGNRSVTVPFSDDNAVFDPSSSGLDDEVEDLPTHEVVAAEITEPEESEPEIATVVAEFDGEPIFSSPDSEAADNIQEVEAIETDEELQSGAEIEVAEDDDEPTGVIADGLIGEFLGSNEPESESIEVEAADQNVETETKEPALEEVSAEIEDTNNVNPDDLEVVDEEIDSIETEEIEDYFDPDQPAFAARASVPVSTTPLFKVAPPSVPYEEPETIVVENSEADENPSADLNEHEEVTAEVIADEEGIATDATLPVQKIDIALDPTVPIIRPERPAPDYSFEEVPEMEIIEDEVVLGEEITDQITQLDADLDTIEGLVREIELSLADFEPLSGFEVSDEEEKAA